MKAWCCIFILLVCLPACKNTSSKQEGMDTSAQNTLKDSRYDSIVPSNESSHNMPPEVRKYYLHKDSLFELLQKLSHSFHQFLICQFL